MKNKNKNKNKNEIEKTQIDVLKKKKRISALMKVLKLTI